MNQSVSIDTNSSILLNGKYFKMPTSIWTVHYKLSHLAQIISTICTEINLTSTFPVYFDGILDRQELLTSTNGWFTITWYYTTACISTFHIRGRKIEVGSSRNNVVHVPYLAFSDGNDWFVISNFSNNY